MSIRRLISHSCFTRKVLPVEAALTVVEDRLAKDRSLGDRVSILVPHLVELTSLCLRSIDLCSAWRGVLRTDKCSSSGFPLLPVIANLCLESLEVSYTTSIM